MSRILSISYADLDRYDLASEIRKFDEISCELSRKHAAALKSNWDKYNRYWASRSNKPGSIGTAIKGATWLIYQAILDLRYKNLDQLNRLYLGHGDLLEPIEFKEQGNAVVVACFRRKVGKAPTVH